MKQRWQEAWSTQQHGKQTRDIWLKPTHEALALHVGLRRPLSAILTQLTTGKIALRAYLGLIRAADTTECQCRQGRQTVQHILTTCPNFHELRREILWVNRRTTDYRMILRQVDLSRRAAIFLLRTQILGQFQAVQLLTTNDTRSS